MRLILTVTNASAAPVDLAFRSGQSFDFVVLRNEQELWRWSGDQMFTQAIRDETLAAGETLTYEATWRPPAGTGGELVARGILTTQNPVQQETVFRLP